MKFLVDILAAEKLYAREIISNYYDVIGEDNANLMADIFVKVCKDLHVRIQEDGDNSASVILYIIYKTLGLPVKMYTGYSCYPLNDDRITCPYTWLVFNDNETLIIDARYGQKFFIKNKDGLFLGRTLIDAKVNPLCLYYGALNLPLSSNYTFFSLVDFIDFVDNMPDSIGGWDYAQSFLPKNIKIDKNNFKEIDHFVLAPYDQFMFLNAEEIPKNTNFKLRKNILDPKLPQNRGIYTKLGMILKS